MTIFVAAVLALAVSCSNDDDNDNTMQEMSITDINSSGCKMMQSTTDGTRAGNSLQRTKLTFEPNGNGGAMVSLTDIILNCDAESIENVLMTCHNGRIDLVIVPKNREALANCVCPYDCSFYIKRIPSGSYHIRIYVAEGKKSTFNPAYPIHEGEITLAPQQPSSLEW